MIWETLFRLAVKPIPLPLYYPQISSPRYFQTKVKIRLERRKESQDYAKVRSSPNIMDNQVKRGGGGRGSKNADVASSIKTSVRWVQKLYSRYRSTGTVPVLGKPGRPKRIITGQMVQTVQSTFERFRRSAVLLEKIIDTTGTHMPHNTIHKIMRDEGLVDASQRR